MSRTVPIIERVEYENEQEALNAQILPPANLGFIKNMLATDTMRLNNLRPDPESYVKYIQEHAAISGAISAWQHLLNAHEEVIKRLAVD